MPTIGISGFGRMGRLALRAAWGHPGLQSTMVVDGACVDMLAWYDNEIGSGERMIELAEKVGASL